jgi:hypothetical protein
MSRELTAVEPVRIRVFLGLLLCRVGNRVLEPARLSEPACQEDMVSVD